MNMFIPLFFSILLSAGHSSFPSLIGLSLTNIDSAEGMIWLGIYDSQENFLIKEKAILKGYTIEKPGKMQIDLSDLPYGTYAIAVFHDINNNGYLDQNLLGIPSEPFAFSKNPNSKFRIPRFQEVSYTFQPGAEHLEIALKKWWKH